MVFGPVLQSLTQKKSNFAWGKAKLSQPARELSLAFPQAKLLFFFVKDCKAQAEISEMIQMEGFQSSFIKCKNQTLIQPPML